MSVDRSHSSTDPRAPRTPVAVGGMSSVMHMFVDHSLIEIDLDNGNIAAAFRVYPTLPDATEVRGLNWMFVFTLIKCLVRILPVGICLFAIHYLNSR